MIDLMAGDELLRRRLLAYADLRLSPDLTTSSRLRARVMAVAHRHASLARADAALTLLPRPAGADGAPPADEMGVAARAARRSMAQRQGRQRRLAGAVLAASMGAAMAIGGVYAARPGGPLYDARLWAEALTLPGDPSARAVAELDRLRERLREIGEASRAGDTAGAMAALAAYESIVEEASASAILAHDDVAAAVLETGVGRNVEVLRALAAKVPDTAAAAITRAVDAAIARSADAVERIEASQPSGDGDGDGDGGAAPGPASPPRATTTPTPAPAGTTTAKPKPTQKPATPRPAATPRAAATPDRTPKPRVNQGQLEPAASAEAPPESDDQDEDD